MSDSGELRECAVCTKHRSDGEEVCVYADKGLWCCPICGEPVNRPAPAGEGVDVEQIRKWCGHHKEDQGGALHACGYLCFERSGDDGWCNNAVCPIRKHLPHTAAGEGGEPVSGMGCLRRAGVAQGDGGEGGE